MQEDIQDVVQLAVTPPQEAAKNIDRSNLLNTTPDNYVELREELEPTAISYEYPSTAEAATAEYMRLSTQNASLAKPDVEKLDYISRMGKFIYQQTVDAPNTAQEIIKLRNKEMDDPANFTDNDREILAGLNVEQQEQAQNNYGIDTPLEQLPAQVLGVVGDAVRAVSDNALLIAGFTAAGGSLGALGGPLAPVSVPAGLATGFGSGVVAAQFLKGYQDTRGMLSNDLANVKDDNGQPLSLETRTNVSHGVALISGAASAYVGNAIIKANPLLSKFLSPGKVVDIVSNPALRAKVDILGYMSKAAFAGGGAAAVTEFSKVVGEEIAKTDGSDAAVENVLNVLASEEGVKRIATATGIGFTAGGVIAGATSIPFYKKIKSNYAEVNKQVGAMLGEDTIVVYEDGTYSLERKGGLQDFSDPEAAAKATPGGTPDAPAVLPAVDNKIPNSTKVLKAQDAIMNMAKASNATEMNNLSPAELSNFKKLMFNQAGMAKFWVTKEDMQSFSTNEERGKAIRDRLDPSGLLNSQLNAPIPIEAHKFLEIVKEFPEVSEYVRLNPAGPNPKEAKNFLTRLQEAEGKRQEILSSLGVDKAITPEHQAIVGEALNSIQEASQPFNEGDYFDKPTFTSAIEGVLSQEEVDKYNLAQVDARLAVAKSLKADVDKEFNSKESVAYKEIRKAQIKTELAEMDAALNIINQFTTKEKNSVTNRLTDQHMKVAGEGKRSPYAIDPRYLPDDLREAYVNDPVLQKRKVFVLGGLSPDEAAVMLKVDTGENLLKILANTPDRKDIIKGREQLNIELKNQIKQGFKAEKIDEYDMAFTNLTKAHTREMKFMREKRWGDTKSGIKRIALPLPTVKELNVKAQGVIASTPIKDLNVQQFVVGERRSQRAAVDHILKNEVEQAYKAKENAALNSELAKETLKAKARVKKAETFLKKLKDPETRQELKDAGPSYINAIDELMDGYNFDTSKRGLTKKGAYMEWAKRQVKDGNVDFLIPDKFNDVRESSSELSSEQYLAITDYAQTIVQRAKMKNKLYKKFKEKQMIQTVEAIVTESGRLLQEHPDFNLNRVKEDVPEHTLDSFEKLQVMFSTLLTVVDNAEAIVATMDEEKLGGYHRDLFIKPAREAMNYKSQLDLDFVTNMKENIDHYGKAEFNKMFTEVSYIPEFADFPDLGNGHMFKRDMLIAVAYMGDPYTKAKFSNTVSRKGDRMSLEVMKKVLERELTVKDVTLVQNMILNSFKGQTKKLSSELHKRTTGQDAVMVEGAPFELHGIMFDGGYMTARYRYTSDEVKIGKHIADLEKKAAVFFGNEDGKLYSQLAAAEQTEQGRLADRTGSTRPLDFNFNNFIHSHQEINHDIAFRETGIDTLKLLKNPVMAKNIKATVGNAKYKVLTNSFIELIGNSNELNRNYYGDQQRLISDILAFGKGGMVLTLLAGSFSSMAIQPMSLINVSTRMGVTGPKHIAEASAILAANMHNYTEISELLEKLNPSLKFHRDAIDDALIKSVFEFLPNSPGRFKRYKRTGKAVSTLLNGRKHYMNFLMSGMSRVDQEIKKVATLAAYKQFINGDVENYPKERLALMSDSEKFTKAKDYIDQLSKLALTASSTFDKSYFEKSVFAAPFNNFFTDARSQFNSQLALGRKAKWGGQKAYEGAKEGDFRKVSKGAQQAAGAIMTAAIAGAVYQIVQDIIRGNDNPTKHMTDIKTSEDVVNFAEDTLGYFSTSLPASLAETTPIVKDVLYAYKFGKKSSRSDYRNVSFPMVKQLSDITTGISGLADTLEMSMDWMKGEDNGVTLSKEQVKAMLFSAGYLTHAVPANGIYKMKKALESEEVETGTEFIKNEAKRLNQNIDKFIDRYKDTPDAKDYIEDLKQVQTEILPKYDNDVTKVIPENTKEVFSKVLSNGQWDKFDPQTGAAGIYQFTEERWEEIKAKAPELVLTEDGRVSKSAVQQEKAIDWELKDNTRGFIALDLPVTNENLLGAHKFGFDNYVNLLTVDDSQKLSEVLGDEANNPVFDGFKTVKSVKDYIRKEVNN